MKSSNPPPVVGAEWGQVLDRLGAGTVMVVGRTGTGKTRLARYLAEQLSARGERAALLDADMGQASVGVPTCLALSLGPPWDNPSALWFVGDTTPVANLLPAVVGSARLVRRAREEGARAVVIDTTGLVEGPVARILKYHKALAAGVDQVIAVQHLAELEPLLALLAVPGRAVHRLSPVPQARDRDPAERKRYREERFRAHLRGGRVVSFRPDLLIGPDWLLGLTPGTRLPPPGSVVGLLDLQGFCLSLGLVEEIHPDRLSVYTAFARPDEVVRLQAGRLRLTREGEELP